MSYYMICPKCGKGTIARYATDGNVILGIEVVK